jgi:hypothetical protein
MAKEVTKHCEVFRGRRVGRGSYLPLVLIFIILRSTVSQRFGLRGSFLSPRPRGRPGGILILPP